jgi:hypothetical protein
VRSQSLFLEAETDPKAAQVYLSFQAESKCNCTDNTIKKAEGEKSNVLTTFIWT